MPSRARYIADFQVSANDIVDGAITPSDLGTIYTSNVTEGTNLYFSNARVRDAITTGNNISYNSTTGNITLSPSGVTPTTYGNATIVPVLTIDTFGRVTAASNVTISGGGTVAWQSVQTTGFTAVSGRAYPCNTTSAAFTVTLPSSPTAGDLITLTDYAGTWKTNNLTVNPNGGKINGSTANAVYNVNKQSMQLVYVDSTQGWVVYAAFNSVELGAPPSVQYLVVAGGGGGGKERGGGGGAGGFRTSTTFSVTAGSSYTVTVGAGGAGSTSQGVTGTSGSNSVFSTVTSAGGGGGGSGANVGQNGVNGGSGGGGGSNRYNTQSPQATSGGSGNTPSTSPSQGNNGGGGSYGNNDQNEAGGGGGGAGGAGASVSPANGGINGGAGGSGASSSISGSSVTYAGGGGGGAFASGSTPGAGGSGGGGTGGGRTTNSTSGTANTGGGGGGGGWTDTADGNGGAGGSGVVIISYSTSFADLLSIGGGLTYTKTTSGGNTIYTFTAGTGTISW